MKKFFRPVASAALAALFALSPMAASGNAFPTMSIIAEAAEKLPPPENVTASSTTDSITLKWDAVDGADGYKIMIYNREAKEFEKYKNVTGTSCKVTDLEKNTKYYFKIAALDKSGDKYYAQTFTEKLSASTKASSLPKPPSEDYTGFASKDGKKYYFTEGKIAQGFKKVNDKYYYFTENGMLNGWLEYYGIYYYFDKNGIMAANKKLIINDVTYTFNPDGTLEWNSDYEIKAKHTVKGEEPKFSIIMTPEYFDEVDIAAFYIENEGNKDIEIQLIGKSFDDIDSNYDRAMVLLDNDFDPTEEPLVIKPGSGAFVIFGLSDSTRYTGRTLYAFDINYDKTNYVVISSEYYGTYFSESHAKLDKIISSAFDADKDQIDQNNYRSV